MKIFFQTHDRGGLENERLLFVQFNRMLKRDPAVVAKLTGKLCFSFFWDALRAKMQDKNSPIDYSYIEKHSSLTKIK